MTLLSLIKASKDFGIKSLFKNLDLHINERERLGLIGKNGSGKSTLLKVIAGFEPLLEGERHCSTSLSIKFVGQESEANNNLSILEEVFKGCGQKRNLLFRFNEISKLVANSPNDQNLLKKLGDVSEEMDQTNTWNLEQQCKEILGKLGIKDLDKKLKDLSGGYRKRVDLASALVSNPDVLLLDEPTNHLDASAVEWLQSWLDRYRGAIILVTHDRYVLDRVTNKMIEIDQGEIRLYKGNYSTYLKQKVEQEYTEKLMQKKIKGVLRKELAWLKRGPKARSTKQKARIQRIKEMQSRSIKTIEKSLEMSSLNDRIGKIAIEAESLGIKVSRNYDNQVILKDFTYSFSPEDRVGIIGPNGSGKSSLLDILAGRKKPSSGNIRLGETVNIGYLDQNTESLLVGKGLDRKVIEFVEEAALRINLGKKEITASQLLERFLFSPAQQHSPLSKLSGGEKRRLSLCRILIKRPNILLLDEPTNDLDIETLSVLEDFIDDFNGCVIVVSHDRYFLDRTVDRIFNFNDSHLNRFEGNYSEFLEHTLIKNKQEVIKKKNYIQSDVNTINNKSALENKANSRKLRYKDIIEIKEIEQSLVRLEEKKTILEKKINEGSGDLSESSQELANTIQSIDKKEERWLELNDIYS